MQSNPIRLPIKYVRSSIVVISVLASHFACKHAAQTGNAELLTAQPPTGAGVPEDTYYTKLVNGKKYKEALKHVCNTFPVLDCSRVRFVDRQNTGAYAITSVLNIITIYPSAFVHKQSGAILPGWLAAVIWHEMTHVKQNNYVRWVVNGAQQRVLGNYRYDAGLELEGWASMVDRNRFPLNCSMQLEIEQNIYYFNKILENGGKRPKNEDDEDKNYSLSNERMGQVLNHCRAALQAKYGHTETASPVATSKLKVNDIVPEEVQADLAPAN